MDQIYPFQIGHHEAKEIKSKIGLYKCIINGFPPSIVVYHSNAHLHDEY